MMKLPGEPQASAYKPKAKGRWRATGRRRREVHPLHTKTNTIRFDNGRTHPITIGGSTAITNNYGGYFLRSGTFDNIAKENVQRRRIHRYDTRTLLTRRREGLQQR